MSRKAVVRTIGGVFAALLLLLGAAIAALFLLDWSVLKPYVESAVGDALDRQVEIASFAVEPGTVSTIHVQGLQVANPPWAEEQNLVTVEELRVRLRTWPLLLGRLEVTEVAVTKPVLALERNAEEQVTWDVGPVAEAAGEGVAPETRREFPAIGHLAIENASAVYRDAVQDLELEAGIASLTGDLMGGNRMQLSLDGSLERQPLSLTFEGGSPQALRESEQPFPVDLTLKLADSELSVQGTIRHPLQLAGIDLDFRLQGPGFRQVLSIAGLSPPDTPPYSLAGSLGREDEVWRVTQFEGSLGDSDLSGSLSLDLGADPPFLEGDLVSGRLNLDELTALAEPAEPEDDSLFPATPLPAERLHALDADVTFTVSQIISKLAPVDELSARLRVKDGRAAVNPLEVKTGGDTIAGEFALNARNEVPSADARLSLDGLDIQPFFKNTQFAQEMSGRLSGELYLLGVGQSLDEMMATARGEGWVGVGEGSVSALVVEAIGLDIVEALALVAGEDTPVGIRCGRADLSASDGIARLEKAIIDTTDSVVLAQGKVDLGEETLNMQIEARAKDFSLVDVAAPVELSGSLTYPAVSIGVLDPLPFLELGQADDLDCERLLAGELQLREVEED